MSRLEMQNNVRGKLSPLVERKSSPIHNEGLFATENIDAETIIQKTHILSPFGWFHIVPNSRYNHSKDKENCKIVTDEKFKQIVSIRDIEKNEELLVNYHKDKDLEQPQKGWKE